VVAYGWAAIAAALGAIAGFLPDLVSIVLIVVVARLALKAGRFLADQIERGTLVVPAFHPEWAMPTYRVARFLVVVLAAAVIFPYLPGPISRALQALAVFLGIVLALGSMPAVSNMVSGMLLTYMRPFSLGDRVRIADVEGHVIERNLLLVRIRTAEDVEVTLSSAKVLGSAICNYGGAGRASDPAVPSTTIVAEQGAQEQQVADRSDVQSAPRDVAGGSAQDRIRGGPVSPRL
jgi:small-conductance mechanosensitive channel